METTERKAGHSRWWWAAGVVIILLIAMVVVRARQVRSTPPQDLTPWALDTGLVLAQPVDRGFPALATVETRGEITVTGQISGTIERMGPREGVAVRKGDFLARIDTREIDDNIQALQAKLEAARADVEHRKNELMREEKLFGEGGSSETAVESYRTAEIASRNNVRALEQQISALDVRKGYGNVVAPAAGVISARLREPGDVCLMGHPIYRLTVSGGARVRVKLPQSAISEIEPGTTLELTTGSDTMAVRLDRIYPSLDAEALGAAEADLNRPPFGLPSGARVAARVIIEKSLDAVRIPHRAVVNAEPGQETRVFEVVDDGGTTRIRAVPVTVELVGRDGIAVLGDLSAGDRVIVAHESSLLKLRDNDPVIVKARGES